MLAIIGFVVLILIGLYLLVGTIWSLAAASAGFVSPIGSLVLGTLTAAVFWTAFHFAPFYITFTG